MARTAKKSRSRAELDNNLGNRKRPPAPRADLYREPPPPPEFLAGEHARELWQKLANQLVELQLLTPLDVEALVVLCEAWQQYLDLSAYALAENSFITTKTGYVAEHPGVRMRKQAAGLLLQLWRQFGLTPLTRENLDVDLQAATEDSLGAFAGRRD